MFYLGIILGYLLSTTTIVVTYLVVTKKKDKIVKVVEKVEHYLKTKQPIAVIRHKTEAEEAYEHILNINSDRGGIPDSELK